MASHIRGLAALGKSEDSYGALLVSIIPGKLPAETRSNLARSHINPEWTPSELDEYFKIEIRVLKSGFSEELSKKFSVIHLHCQRQLHHFILEPAMVLYLLATLCIGLFKVSSYLLVKLWQ